MVRGTKRGHRLINTNEKSIGFIVPSSAISKDLRLDASFYTPDVIMAKQILQKSRFKIIKINDLCNDVFTLPRFKRIWVPNRTNGFPYLDQI